MTSCGTCKHYTTGLLDNGSACARPLGVCIPWSGPGPSHGAVRDSKRRWEDHAEYLAGLTEVLLRQIPERLIVMGDFNQVVGPGARAPAELSSALCATLPPGMTIATSSLGFRPHCAER